MMTYELTLMAGVSNINTMIRNNLLPERTLESIKCHRKLDKYKSLLGEKSANAAGGPPPPAARAIVPVAVANPTSSISTKGVVG